MSLGVNIKKIRQEKNLSQEQFADIFHVTRQTVSNWENDKNYPDLSSLKQMSDKFDVSLDTLLKEDEKFIGKTDKTIKQTSLLKRAVIVLVIIITILAGRCLWVFHLAAMPTPDGERINSDTDIKMVTNLPDSSPSRAITYTTELRQEDSKYQDKIDKYKIAVFGGVEGDIPAVYLDKSPTVILHFQDLYNNDIKPERVLNVSSEIYDMYSDREGMFKRDLDYKLENKEVEVVISPEIDQSLNDEGDIWWQCIITIEYSYKGKLYTGITAVNVFGTQL